MSTDSKTLHGLNLDIFRINESNTSGLEEFPDNGIYIKPTNVIGRGDVTGFVLTCTNINGKSEWTDPQYLPNISSKQSVRVASVVDLDLTLPVNVVDGINLNPEDRVLVKNQILLENNGIYSRELNGLLTRSYDAELGMVSTGAYTVVTEGIVNAETIWLSPEYDSVFGDPITFVLISGIPLTPGGNNGTIQYNDGGLFGGINGLTTNGTNVLSFSDNTSAVFGGEMSIYHDGINSIIDNVGPGELLINGVGNIIIQDNLIMNESGYINQEIIGNSNSTNSVTDINLLNVNSIYVQGSILYYTTSLGIFGTINIETLSLISSITPVITNRKVKTLAKHSFVTSNGGFYITDISDPSNLIVVGNVVDANLVGSESFDVSGDHAYVGCTDRLTSVDISDPSLPTVTSSLISAPDFNGRIVDVKVYGMYAYVLSELNAFNIVSINDPSIMVIVGSVNVDTNICMAIRGTSVYIGGTDRVSVLDISDKTTPVVSSSNIDVVYNNVTDMVLTGEIL
jgi:hypothetical protein